jgi:hypothetical protein
MGLLGHSQVRQLERKEEMKAYPRDDERFVERRTSVKDWSVFSDKSFPIGTNFDSLSLRFPGTGV